MDERGPLIRWIWGYDSSGARVTGAEPIGFVWCEHCGDYHPSRAALRVLHLQPLPGMERRVLAGMATAEFPPDDD